LPQRFVLLPISRRFLTSGGAVENEVENEVGQVGGLMEKPGKARKCHGNGDAALGSQANGNCRWRF